jgi:hypothetical protein
MDLGKVIDLAEIAPAAQIAAAEFIGAQASERFYSGATEICSL